jgi:hypothetical protein
MTNLSTEQQDAIKVIFDNAGGVTLNFGIWERKWRGEQLLGAEKKGDWAHWYDASRIKQAAHDYHDYVTYGSTSGLARHDEDTAMLDPTHDQIRNGGYRVYGYRGIDDLKDAAWEVPDYDCGWASIREFIDHFGDLQYEQLRYEVEPYREGN